MRKWGLSSTQYDEILESQNYVCAICLTNPDSKSLAVDHDHITGRIRGLLCYRCNHFLVGRHRDPDLVQRIADYLRKGTDYYVPKVKKTSSRRRKVTKKRK